ncbi:unnamed protein product [Lactuca virosa]|uniref:Uncharacterized protein n=1 Tax=Lactuca virosa TaxID=75947 RepID=A0AAU9LKT7_9ASTR|nr:unnamed protein product [Lactuca virosa]
MLPPSPPNRRRKKRGSVVFQEKALPARRTMESEDGPPTSLRMTQSRTSAYPHRQRSTDLPYLSFSSSRFPILSSFPTVKKLVAIIAVEITEGPNIPFHLGIQDKDDAHMSVNEVIYHGIPNGRCLTTL